MALALWYTETGMGLADIVYIVLAVVAAGGLIGFIYSKVGRRPQIGPTTFVLFVVGVLGIAFWGIFLSGLNDTLAEAIEDGRQAQNEIRQVAMSARYFHQPVPKPDESAVRKVAAMNSAKRSARLLGWDWRKLVPSYRRNQPPAPHRPSPPTKAVPSRSPSGPSKASNR
jgi:hypothetical protein